jgi:hypothetical protein
MFSILANPQYKSLHENTLSLIHTTIGFGTFFISLFFIYLFIWIYNIYWMLIMLLLLNMIIIWIRIVSFFTEGSATQIKEFHTLNGIDRVAPLLKDPNPKIAVEALMIMHACINAQIYDSIDSRNLISNHIFLVFCRSLQIIQQILFVCFLSIFDKIRNIWIDFGQN